MIEFLVILVALGFVGGFLSGLVGLGGAVFMVPLVLYVPQQIASYSLTVRQAEGISIVQVLSASLSGVIHHSRHRRVCMRLVAYAGGGSAAGALAGGVVSLYFPPAVLLGTFASFTSLGALSFLLVPHKECADETPVDRIRFSRALMATVGLGVGFLGGLVGAAGGILLLPIMVHFFRIPTRNAIASNLGIVFLAALFGMTGKAVTGQIDWTPAVALVVGALPGAQLGAHVSGRIATRRLQLLIHVILALAGARMWYQVFSS